MSNSPGKRKEQDNGKIQDCQDVGDVRALLPTMGKLSLNVKAVPYIPKQDGGLQSQSGREANGDSGTKLHGKDNSPTENEQVRVDFSFFYVTKAKSSFCVTKT